MDDQSYKEDNDDTRSCQEIIEIDFDNLDDGHLDYYFQETCKDYRFNFTTNETFSSQENIVEWARKVGRSLNMYLIIDHSTKSKPEYFGRVVLQCERSGRPGVGVTKSKKIGCPFRLRCTEKLLNVWNIVVINGIHNHSMGTYAKGHSTSGRLDFKKRQVIERLSKSMTPKQVLSQLKLTDESDSTTLKKIYNFQHKLKCRNKEGRTVFQQFMKMLRENNYLYWFRTDEQNKSMKDIIVFHPWSVKCLDAFPQVLVMDTTYKTNKYKQPLLDIVGFTCTWKMFIVGYPFLNSEDKETFVWALETLQRVMKMQPNVIVTDRDLALVYAVEKVFCSTAHFLCRRHIEMDIESYVTKLFNSSLIGKSVAGKWNKLIKCKTEKDFLQGWENLQQHYKNIPAILSYL